jgi:uncharacterized membrane protein YfcA
MNALAGGGTNLSFPALIWLGLPSIPANATSAVALWPGSLAGAWGFRREVVRARRWWLWLLVPSLVGGAAGAWLLIHTPPTFFRSIAAWLVLGSTALIAVEPALTKRLGLDQRRERSGGWRALAIGLQFGASLYGGYFGAGLGILVLTALGLLGMSDIRRANGLKNLFSFAIKGVAVLYFIIVGRIVWEAAIILGAGAMLGGYAAARYGRRLEASVMRWTVTGIGIAIAALMFVKLAA